MLLTGWFVNASSGHANASTDYVQQVKPILQERCYACHGALKQEGGLRLDTALLAKQGGDSGAAVNSADAVASLLLHRISATDLSERMPPEGEPLSPEQIGLIQQWIREGASAPDDERPEQDPREHWAFRSPVSPQIPAVADPLWNNSPIDAFIAREQQQRGLQRQPAADKLTLLRRIYIDLIGLPPTRDQQRAFLEDDSATAYEDVVESLLASSHYGERWGRHWMDIWRYSDWWGLGAEVRNSQKHIWHWRDWIIESLNTDKGYDQMLREMLAADELYPGDPDRLRATGFLARQYFKFNRTSWLDETIEHTSKAMLGLTFNCCKCHDHKYDPLSHQDYYRLRAIFEPYQIRTDQIPGELDFEKNGIPRAFDCNLNAPTFVHIRGDDRNPDLNQQVEPGIPDVLAFIDWAVKPVSLPIDAVHPELRAHILQNELEAAQRRITAAKTLLQQVREQPAETPDAELRVLHAEKALQAAEMEPETIRARAAADQARCLPEAAASGTTEPRPTLAAEAARSERQLAVLRAEEEVFRTQLEAAEATETKKAEAEKKIIAAEAKLAAARKSQENPGENYTHLAGALKTLESNLETEDSRRKPFPSVSTGRRTAFVSWLTDNRHPLTARVAVNHIWLRHLGRPLVPTVFDFGRKGTPPDHPELLDWLALEFIQSGYSMKHLHRLIVNSQTYRLTSSSAGVSAETLAQDSGNRWYWRANPLRMEAQIVRDSLLHLAGKLDLKLGGPSIPVKEESSTRRAMYFVHSHNEHQKFLSMFDDANVLDCYRRAESIVPQQALALQNSALAAEMAAEITAQIEADRAAEDDAGFVRAAFQTVLCIQPGEAEQTAAVEGLQRLRAAAAGNQRPQPEQFARQMLIHALVNHNDFITIR